MTWYDFENFVKDIGEENILGFGFDNSSAITFTEENKFTMAGNTKFEVGCIVIVCFDSKGLPFHVYKPVETIQTIYVRDKNVAFGAYDRITIRG